eukprot:TCALIF_13918-PA protein Name:"Protein of unknown function" AED:0.47 eAED:0.72 QI:59/0/0/0.5/0/0.25/4/0/176
MSMKQMIEFDKKLGRYFGYVDLGGASDVGEAEVAANEALVVMVTGLRKFWKIPIAYFMIKGIQSGVLAGVLLEALFQCYKLTLSALVTLAWMWANKLPIATMTDSLQVSSRTAIQWESYFRDTDGYLGVIVPQQRKDFWRLFQTEMLPYCCPSLRPIFLLGEGSDSQTAASSPPGD